MKTFLTIALAFFMGYIGLMVGAAKANILICLLSAASLLIRTSSAITKIFDTSVIIDGRIADVAETGFWAEH